MSTLHLKLAQHFMQQEPRAAARRLELQAPEVVTSILCTLKDHEVGAVLKAMHPSYTAQLLPNLEQVQQARWLQLLNLTDIAAILRHVSQHSTDTYLALLPLKKQTMCRMLISYPDYTVGAWVETDVLTLDDKMSVEDAMLRLKKRAYRGPARLYVVNYQRQIAGQVSIYELLCRSGGQPVADFMDKQVPCLSGYTELGSALSASVWERQDQVAVVNRKQGFIGTLQHYRVRRALKHHEVEQIAPLVSSDLLDAYASSFANVLDLLVPEKP
ncbi:magnesium transporter [Pseudoalteromonas rubra]|uniref:Magnesium transporter n=1 Tax=Pseudoalteromonas rubra TaxID=43658 RepID=A0A5S3WNF2_9GAMM|nr:CBS domain-containing protein [Pseudoalteromonas rubra]TMP29534.1 magnesium transporter [Pseudoalteromonas rubra]TMP35128.1 magnesium transporter [Pseudoalteromonas rubra]